VKLAQAGVILAQVGMCNWHRLHIYVVRYSFVVGRWGDHHHHRHCCCFWYHRFHNHFLIPPHFGLQFYFGNVTHKQFCFHNTAFFNLYAV
jgi:nucleoside-diphosphate-sugar epimerase